MTGGAMYAIISDIHGNLAALETALEHIDGQGIKRILCLGDVVGYGPRPVECLDLVKASCEINTCGNHDVAVLTQGFGFNKYALDAINWTRDQIRPGPLAVAGNRIRWGYLAGLPVSYTEGRILFVHASPRDPVVEYVLESDCDPAGLGPSEKLIDIFSRFEWLCFIGHTHQAGVFTGDFRHLRPVQLPEGRYVVPEDGKAIINVGSIGQPRDGDWRSCYVTVEGNVVQYHRVEYDVERTMAEIRAVDMLDERLAARLKMGR